MIRFTNLRKQFPRRILIILRLSRPELLVNAAFVKQFIVRTTLRNSSVLHNGYLVAKAAGGQAVRNVDSRARSHDTVEFGVNIVLGNRVKRGCRFVKHDKWRAFINRPRKAELLRFAAGDLNAVLVKVLVKTGFLCLEISENLQ